MLKLEPPVIAAIITGAIAVTSLLIQAAINISKNNYDKKTNFEKTLNEKLEKIYAPLNLELDIVSDNDDLATSKVKELVSKYNHLLSPNLFSDYVELIKIEDRKNSPIPFGKKKQPENLAEYQALKEKVIRVTKQEYSDLKLLNDKSFNDVKKERSKKFSERAFSKIWIISNVILFLTCVFFISFAIAESNKLTVAASILGFFLLISITTILFNIVKLLTYLIEVKHQKVNNIFTRTDYVPYTGIFICRYCNQPSHKVKYTLFSDCPEPHNGRRFWRMLYFLPRQWRKAD